MAYASGSRHSCQYRSRHQGPCSTGWRRRCARRFRTDTMIHRSGSGVGGVDGARGAGGQRCRRARRGSACCQRVVAAFCTGGVDAERFDARGTASDCLSISTSPVRHEGSTSRSCTVGCASRDFRSRRILVVTNLRRSCLSAVPSCISERGGDRGGWGPWEGSGARGARHWATMDQRALAVALNAAAQLTGAGGSPAVGHREGSLGLSWGDF